MFSVNFKGFRRRREQVMWVNLLRDLRKCIRRALRE